MPFSSQLCDELHETTSKRRRRWATIMPDVASHGPVPAGHPSPLPPVPRAHHDGEAVGVSTTHTTIIHSDAEIFCLPQAAPSRT